MKILTLILLAIRISGLPSPAGGGSYAPLAPVVPSTLCSAVQSDAVIHIDPVGAAWQPGNNQSADCWGSQLNIR